MKTQLTIQTQTLKSFLQLFERSDTLQNLELTDFDTRFGKDELIDETIFKGLNKVGNILDFDYEFNGLYIFNAKINGLTIEFETDYIIQKYTVIGENFKLRILVNKMIELNWYQENTYLYSEIVPVYDS